MLSFLSKLFGDHNSRLVTKYEKIVSKINAFEPEIALLSDDDLRNMTVKFRERLVAGETLDDILPQAFAVVREASKRIIGLRHFDVQLIGGIALHSGQIAEMKTGEGKTLVATTAVYLNALPGKGVHVVTVNDYLAQRDASWMGKIYNFLGLSVATITSGMFDMMKKRAYEADIIYGTNHEFGFDYLRDNLKFSEKEMVMRGLNFAVVDEVDSILIDEARTPLIISGSADDASNLYIAIDSVVKHVEDEDFEKDEKSRSVNLTDKGVEKIERELKNAGLLISENLYDTSNISIVYHVNCALKAHKIFARNVDYMVRNGEVFIIDEFTGRIMDGRRYSEGLHQAIEAKEGVDVKTESQTVATISYQNLFRLYNKLAGMTGTAMTEEAEFDEIYKLKVVSIPSNKSVLRIDHEDSIFLTIEEKDKAAIALIKECHARQQPVLVGTNSLERSEQFSQKLELEGIKHNVLNAKQHEREAYIVAEAGVPGAVTIATNMAGRGTDIKLGGNLEMRIDLECKDIEAPEKRELKIKEIKEDIAKKQEVVVKAGGLFIIGTERNDSRRVDNQLRGRAGRQGDPGASRFFISLQDDLMRRFGSQQLEKTLRKMGVEQDEDLSHRWVSRAIEKAQQRVEAFNFDIRKQMLKYDDVVNDQRKIIYDQRKSLMQSEAISDQVTDMFSDVIETIIERIAPPNTVPMEWNFEELENSLKTIFSIDIDKEQFSSDPALTQELLTQNLTDKIIAAYKEKTEKYGDNFMQFLEKDVTLKTLDSAWRTHLLALEHLRSGINLRAYAQKNPLNEYKFEAFNIFKDMLHKIKVDVSKSIFKFELNVPPITKPFFTESPEDSADDFIVQEEQPAISSNNAPVRSDRNAPCPCGSGLKYKYCCGALKKIDLTKNRESKEE
ncbi:protein translocase subunit SecA [Alphaproteobacteria bacterium]|nr:protein translocase subunit SecA [Alphaproteobacteria bacterium]